MYNMDDEHKHRVLLTPTNNGKKYHLSPSSSSSSSPFQQRQKRRRRQSPYTNKHNKKLNVNNKSPIDRLMSRFHKNTSPYKTSIPIKTIKRWNSNSSSTTVIDILTNSFTFLYTYATPHISMVILFFDIHILKSKKIKKNIHMHYVFAYH